jgi:type IV pilus assembly protein PilA
MTQALPQGPYPPTGPQPRKTGLPVWAIVLITVSALAIPTLGALSTLAVYGMRKFIQRSKIAEAHQTLGAIAVAARQTYEESARTSTEGAATANLCQSASQPIPFESTLVSAKKYASTSADWQADKANNTGFACLHFALEMPQYYQYNYAATARTFTATAHGDLNGDGVFSTFTLSGQVQDQTVIFAPTISEVRPDE